jgi:hypothetical protein
MMEALSIGLAVYGVAVTAAWVWAEVENRAFKKTRAGWERAHEAAMKLAAQASDIIAANAGYLAPFDHDGDGKPGGSKPRGKG